MTIGSSRYTLAPGPEWTSMAAGWPVRVVSRETEPGHMLVDKEHLERGGEPFKQLHLECGNCAQSVMCLAPDATTPGYLTDAAAIQAAVLSHIRRSHEPT